MTIDQLVNLPARTQTPDTFNANADGIFPQMNTFAAQANALATAMNLNSTTDTSASSVAIGTGAKSFTVSTGKSFQPGMFLMIADTAAPTTNYMQGQVTSYNSGSGALVMSIGSILGSGTKSAWTISQSAPGDLTTTDAQIQSKIAFTTAGTAPTYTITTAPAYGAYAANQRMRVKFHAANAGVASTLNRDGLGAKNLYQYDATGAKVNAVITLNQLADVEYDGTDMVMLDPLPAPGTVPVRQTVLSGPVDTNGLPSFGGATGSTTVTASGTLIATAANGFSLAAAQLNRVGSITNPSWTGLSTNGTMYLYLDIAADGTCTVGSTTLAPTYRWGGADVVTSGQFTFNIQEMVGKVGNGSVATQTYRVFVGEVTVAGAVVTAITWYALRASYDSGYTNTLPGVATLTSKNSNLGIVPTRVSLILKCLTTEGGYAVGATLHAGFLTANGVTVGPHTIQATENTVGFTTGSNTAFYGSNATTGANITLTAANWAYRIVAKRGWEQ